jgi:putative transposase
MTKYTRRGHATGVPMHYVYRHPKGGVPQSSPAALSREANLRLTILEYSRTHTVAATCRHFGIARSTFYRWKERYVPTRLATLENRSSRPVRTRRSTWTTAQVVAVRDLRAQYPRMGKDKVAILLAHEGIILSVSMVGRILQYLRSSHQLIEPLSRTPWKLHIRHQRPYAIRKPKDYTVEHPGDLVQVDTMELRPSAGKIRKHFTAVDLVSRYSVADIRSTATAGTATAFLDRVMAALPAPIRAVQVDGGSEFMAEFETTCRDRGIRLFVLPPRSPKLNGCVERANRTYRSEFYECYDGTLETTALRSELHGFQQLYNHVRPHQALGYRTPAAVLASHGYL